MPLPLIALGLGAAFSLAGAAGARSTNSAIRARVRALMARINKRMTQVRVEALDQVRRRSAIGNMAIAGARNRFGFSGTGLSISERLASLAAGLTVDTDAIGFAEDARLEALRTEKLDMSLSAQAAQTPVGRAAVEGFVSGFSTGIALDTSLAQLSFAQTQSGNFAAYSSIMGSVNATQIFVWPRTFQSYNRQLNRTRADTDLKQDLSRGIESFLHTGGGR